VVEIKKMQLTGRIRHIDRDRGYKTKQNVIIVFDDGFDCEVFLPKSWKIKVGDKIKIVVV
jgi:hypothetical protein